MITFYNVPADTEQDTRIGKQITNVFVFCLFFRFLCFSEREWKLIFKAISGVSLPDDTDPLLRDPYEVWHRNTSYNENIPEERLLHNTCQFKGHYKSSLALDWETRNITEVTKSHYLVWKLTISI